MKYALEEYVLNEFNASSKARKDISLFIKLNGYKTLAVNDKTLIRYNKIAKVLLAIKLYSKILFSLNSNDILFIQTSVRLLEHILKIKRIKKFKLIYLIHDIFSIRYSEEDSMKNNIKQITADINNLSQCDYVIAHNPIMIEKLKTLGCNSELISLDIFDYDTKEEPINRAHKENETWQITFAGHLPKSTFLQKIDSSLHTYEMIIYGGPTMEFKTSTYKGKVDPNKLSGIIEGHFGLVWEGDYKLDAKDNYTVLNNPHKLSMYITAGLPIIAWKNSAAAYFIEKHKIGISISSLDEIDNILKGITEDTYSTYVYNTLKMRDSLVKGKYISHALSQCEK